MASKCYEWTTGTRANSDYSCAYRVGCNVTSIDVTSTRNQYNTRNSSYADEYHSFRPILKVK